MWTEEKTGELFNGIKKLNERINLPQTLLDWLHNGNIKGKKNPKKQNTQVDTRNINASNFY